MADEGGSALTSAGELTPEEGRRDRKRRETRDALANAAMALFATKGFSETTVADIAEAADVATRTFYRYFDTKEDTVLVEILSYFADVEEVLERCQGDWSPFTCYFAVIDQLEEKWGRQPGELDFLSGLIDGNDVLLGRFRSITAQHQDRVCAIFARRLGIDYYDPRAWAIASAGIEAFLGSLVISVRGDRQRNSFEVAEELLLIYAAGVDPEAETKRREAIRSRKKQRRSRA